MNLSMRSRANRTKEENYRGNDCAIIHREIYAAEQQVNEEIIPDNFSRLSGSCSRHGIPKRFIDLSPVLELVHEARPSKIHKAPEMRKGSN